MVCGGPAVAGGGKHQAQLVADAGLALELVQRGWTQCRLDGAFLRFGVRVDG